MTMNKKDNRGGARPGAGRKPKDGTPRLFTNIRIDRKAYEAIPENVNKCDYVSDLILDALKEYKNNRK